MNLAADQHVKCLLVNGISIEGYVDIWDDNVVKLRSLDGKSLFVIHSPDRDIVLTKIILEDDEEEVVEQKDYPLPKREPIEVKTELEKEFVQEYEKPSDDEFRIKRLAELRVLLAEQEKKIVADKLKDHQVGEIRKVEYGYPGFFPKPRAK